jgi:DNA-binding transcriptional regulator YiaG
VASVKSITTTKKRRAASSSGSALSTGAGKRRPAQAKRSSRTGRKAAAAHSPVSVRSLREELGLSRKVFSRLCNYSERAIAAWEAGKPLGANTRQRMVELRRLQQALAGVMKSTFIGEWLQTPNRAFDGLKPLEVIERGQIDRIWRMLHLLESGEPA